MIYPWQYELLERKEKVEHNLWSKEQTRFWGDGREQKHWLEVVYNKCPQVAVGVFTYLCTAIWSIFFAFSTTNQPWCNVLSRRWLSNCVAASYLCLTTRYGGPTATGELKGMRKTCHGWGEAPLSIPFMLPPSPGHQLLMAGDSRSRNVNHP